MTDEQVALYWLKRIADLGKYGPGCGGSTVVEDAVLICVGHAMAALGLRGPV